MLVYFTDFFNVSPEALSEYGALNVSLIADLPLFIDPFLLFNSHKPDYQQLHEEMIEYIRFLREKSTSTPLDIGTINQWYRFAEVKQNWLGYSATGNEGRGLGPNFAHALHGNFNTVFKNFGDEKIQSSPHIEKLALVGTGVGRDNVSDFTTNLIKKYLLEYTQEFARQHIDPKLCQKFWVKRVEFVYETETWATRSFVLPTFRGDFVILTPEDMLTKDDMWISQQDLFHNFSHIADSIPNIQLRAQINNYFRNVLDDMLARKKRSDSKRRKMKRAGDDGEPRISAADRAAAKALAIQQFPQILDYYIAYKEETGDEAVAASQHKVEETKELFIEQITKLVELLSGTEFYAEPENSYDAAMKRVQYLKTVIEDNDGYRLFYIKGQPVQREADLQIMYRLTWFASAFDVNRETNNGRGPVDYAVSMGSGDKSLVEFKLASNSKLAQNLENQTAVYEKASQAKASIKVILFFSEGELERVRSILRALDKLEDPSIVLIDARSDNKVSASNVKTPKPAKA